MGAGELSQNPGIGLGVDKRNSSIGQGSPGRTQNAKRTRAARARDGQVRASLTTKFSAAGEKYIWKSPLAWKTQIRMIIYMGADMPVYAFSLFLPSIINQLRRWIHYGSVRPPRIFQPPFASVRNTVEACGTVNGESNEAEVTAVEAGFRRTCTLIFIVVSLPKVITGTKAECVDCTPRDEGLPMGAQYKNY
ncbi:hypothetical protein B0H16DRAFT_1484116 [Mycena metata]|uniref:Uncharacterized protein n=1 Tax=Mycena metata TaxID=1033252 RepID=A0AAD7GPR9_9AGAR|nr:hypothetical protein B0H16DRAFT_1484116 [Mycena metata]